MRRGYQPQKQTSHPNGEAAPGFRFGGLARSGRGESHGADFASPQIKAVDPASEISQLLVADLGSFTAGGFSLKEPCSAPGCGGLFGLRASRWFGGEDMLASPQNRF